MRICPVLTSRLLPPRAPSDGFISQYFPHLASRLEQERSGETNLGHSKFHDCLRAFYRAYVLKSPNGCPVLFLLKCFCTVSHGMNCNLFGVSLDKLVAFCCTQEGCIGIFTIRSYQFGISRMRSITAACCWVIRICFVA